jgi:hypothetical protein
MEIFFIIRQPRYFGRIFLRSIKTSRKPNQNGTTTRWNTSIFHRASNAGSRVARVSNPGLMITNPNPSTGRITTETLTAIDPGWATDHPDVLIHAPFLLLAAPQRRPGLHQRLEHPLATGSIR